MEEELKLKSSGKFIAVRILVYFMILGIIICGFFGLVDLRSDAQKSADEREELVSSFAFQCGVEALQWFQSHRSSNYNIAKVSSVTFLEHYNKYVLVKYENVFGEDEEACYSATTKKGYPGGDLFRDALRDLRAYDNFIGDESGKSYTTKFEGKKLAIMFEEAGIYGFIILQ